MPRFAANLTLLFTELAFEDRFAAAARAGFTGVEVLFPYDRPGAEIRRLIDAAGLEFVLMNAPVRDGAEASPAYPCVPGNGPAFRQDAQRFLDQARALRPRHIHVMAGFAQGPEARAAFISNLQWLSDQAPEQGFTIEPLNQGDQPGYFLSDYALAADIIAAVDRPNLGLQYDTYHAQVIHGDALGVWQAFAPLVTHIQVGASPDRTEPGPGSIDFPRLFEAIDAAGYDGWVSAEYHPSTARTEDGLGWLT